jgi:two-component system cell cycle response regulator DivK
MACVFRVPPYNDFSRNQWSCFTGFARDGVAIRQPRKVESATAAMPKTILIVEDNELNMKLFNDLLQAHGYNTLQAKDGRVVVDLTRKNRPDLILMDIQLPEISGLEITKMLKADDDLRSIPVVAITAFAMKGDEQKIRNGGCDGYIAKPISVASFLQTVSRFLEPQAAQ